jgi:glyoxylase-like metal-dependent hydrolase (beta-lactamase superfamily II)
MTEATTRPRRQEQEEATEDITEVAPGVLRAQLPVNLPGLGHVNCYLLEDERGLAVVDPGLPGEDSWRDLNDRLTRAGYKVADIHTSVITHSHFDHFGGSARITEETGAGLLTHESFRIHWNGSEADENEDSSALAPATEAEQDAEIDRVFSERLPWGTERQRPPEEQIERMRRIGRFGDAWMRTPDPTHKVADTETVMLARREWVAVHTPGHTHDHLCLWDPEHGIMISGDHVLPTITPHISGMSPLSDDPLKEFFDSLERMTTFGDVSVVLPAHGHPFTDLAGRSRDIIDHHEERLDTIRDATEKIEHGTVTDYMRVLFRERAWGDMAESETYAHLEHLRELGELSRNDPEGVAHYLAR